MPVKEARFRKVVGSFHLTGTNEPTSANRMVLSQRIFWSMKAPGDVPTMRPTIMAEMIAISAYRFAHR